MVICRLRKNAEFRLTGGSNRSASVSLPQITANSNPAASGVGGDGLRFSGGESMARKGCSSYDSHSVEQLDSASESNQKVTSETAAHAESSSRLKVYCCSCLWMNCVELFIFNDMP